jgi:hypothetical protein
MDGLQSARLLRCHAMQWRNGAMAQWHDMTISSHVLHHHKLDRIACCLSSIRLLWLSFP